MLLRSSLPDAGSVGPMPLVGTPVARREDRRLLTGDARYIADLDLPGCLSVTYVTSPIAHAVIRTVDVDAARSAPGVVDVVTAADLDIGPQPQISPAYPPTMARPLLADGRMRFVGEAVVAIVSETDAQGEDAAELVGIDYDPLPAVTKLDVAERGEVLLFPEAGTNVVTTREGGSEAVGDTLAGCDVVVSAALVNQRLAPCPLEGRAGASLWGDDGRLVHWSSCQGAHPVRAVMAEVHGLSPDQVRVIAPDTGGSFGAKARPHPEEILLPWLARRSGRPVRWVPPRSTDMVGLGHSRAQRQQVEIGGDRDGTIRALRIRIDGDAGSYPMVGPLLVANTAVMSAGAYRIPVVQWSTRAFVTNTTPIVAYRGAGRPEAANLIERAIDVFAAELGRDPVEVRRDNLLDADDFPYDSRDGHAPRQWRLPGGPGPRVGSGRLRRPAGGAGPPSGGRRAPPAWRRPGDLRGSDRRRARHGVRRRRAAARRHDRGRHRVDTVRSGPPHGVGDARRRSDRGADRSHRGGARRHRRRAPRGAHRGLTVGAEGGRGRRRGHGCPRRGRPRGGGGTAGGHGRRRGPRHGHRTVPRGRRTRGPRRGLGRARRPSRPGPGAAVRGRLRRRRTDGSLRRLCGCGRGRPRHRRSGAAPVGDRRRRRHDHQPDAGAGADPRRAGAGRRPGPVRRVQL